MTNLFSELEKMGLDSLNFNEQEKPLLAQFIDLSTPFFDTLCQHKPDKTSHDLILGLLTKAHQEAFDNYLATLPKISELKTMFTDQVGSEHASKFSTLNQAELAVISSLWFMTQGYTGIDYSYANDKAIETAKLLSENNQEQDDTKQFESYRSKFMQAYYTGIDFARKNQPSTSLYLTIKKHIKRLFNKS